MLVSFLTPVHATPTFRLRQARGKGPKRRKGHQMRGTLFRGLALSVVYKCPPQVSRSLLPTPHRPSTPARRLKFDLHRKRVAGAVRLQDPAQDPEIASACNALLVAPRPSSGCSIFMIEHFLGYTPLQLNTVPEVFTTRLSLPADQTYAPNQTLSVETANISPRDSEYKTCA